MSKLVIKVSFYSHGIKFVGAKRNYLKILYLNINFHLFSRNQLFKVLNVIIIKKINFF